MNGVQDEILRRFERFIARIREGKPAAAIEEFGRVGGVLRTGGLAVPQGFIAACVDGFIDLLRQTGRSDAVLTAAGEALKAVGFDPRWACAKGEALFDLGRFEEARQSLEPLAGEGEAADPEACYLLGCIAERRGDDAAAAGYFGRANELDPDAYQLPVPVSEESAVSVCRECLSELPGPIKDFVSEVPIFVDALPSDELLGGPQTPLDPLVLGVFLGCTAREGPGVWPDEQPRIVLFHRNIGKVAGDPDSLRSELRTTLFHEIGHALGFEEDELDAMGLA